MDWQTIVIAILGAIDLGFFIKWLFVPSERKKLTVEAQERENRMWHDRLAEQREATKDLNEVVSMLTEQMKHLTAENTDKTRLIRDLNSRLLQEQEKNLRYERLIAVKDKFIVWLRQWHCERENNGRKSGCDRRKPQQPTPMEYDPPTEMQQPMLSENAESEQLNNNDDEHD